MNFIERIIYSVLPRRCAYCGKPVSADDCKCTECEKNLSRITGKICPSCGREIDFCSCKNAEMYFKRVVAPFYFEGNVRKGIHAFKFRKAPDNAEAYSAEMAKTVAEKYNGICFDYITEVPMTNKRLKSRGYNQCSLLASEISEKSGIEYKPAVLKKLYETDAQHGLSYFLRKGNLTGVFDVECPDIVKDKVILICDDICTSGETFNECAKMLWLYGAKEVYCIAVALTKSGRKGR